MEKAGLDTKHSNAEISAKSFLLNDETKFEDYFNKIIEKKEGLNNFEINELEKKLADFDKIIENAHELRLQAGRLLDYNKMKKNNASSVQISKYKDEDDYNIQKAKNYIEQIKKLKSYMFGYPANMYEDSSLTKYFRHLEVELPFLNECGDAFESGFYSMDAKKDYEIPILNKIFQHLGLEEYQNNSSKKGAWGYITQGGSESNQWGIMNGVRKYPDGIVYYSASAHYSVKKAVGVVDPNFKFLKPFVESAMIPTEENSHKINSKLLIRKILENQKNGVRPAIILLTWGTTETGDIDDVEEISRELKKLNIPFYIHLDAAMYGGIARNQKNAPIVPNMEKAHVDSISISLHKYFGNTTVNSIVISKTRPATRIIDYIGMKDSTTSGSRGFNPCSTYQRVIETLERRSPFEYEKNIKFFENLLKECKIQYSKPNLSNTFVIDKPDDKICKKYQLSAFKDDKGKNKAHIIIFPYHDKKIMEELAKDLENS